MSFGICPLSVTESASVTFDNRLLSNECVWDTITDIESFSNYFSFVQSTKIISNSHSNVSKYSREHGKQRQQQCGSINDTNNNSHINSSGGVGTGSSPDTRRCSTVATKAVVADKGTTWEEVRTFNGKNHLLIKQVVNMNDTIITTDDDDVDDDSYNSDGNLNPTKNQTKKRQQQPPVKQRRIKSMQLIVTYPSSKYPSTLTRNSINNNNNSNLLTIGVDNDKEEKDETRPRQHNNNNNNNSIRNNDKWSKYGVNTSTLLLEIPIIPMEIQQQQEQQVQHEDDDNNMYYQSRLIVTMAYIRQANWFYRILLLCLFRYRTNQFSSTAQHYLQEEINEIITEAKKRDGC